jgi:predicted DCC family thiol-disulfide oxidoreductase YuxK
MSGPEATVLYDEDCGFCKWSLDKILAWDRSRKLRPVPIQSDEGQRLLAGVPEEKRLESWHLVDASGTVRSAGAAAPPLLDLMPGGRPLAAAGRRFPRASERAYRAVAGNRDRLARLLRIDATCSVRR